MKIADSRSKPFDSKKQIGMAYRLRSSLDATALGSHTNIGVVPGNMLLLRLIF
jgi:hypothetical protein